MVLKYRYLGKGVTDSNGIAHMTEDAEGQTVTGYTGTGRGLTDIIASIDDSTAIGDSSIQSGTYDVWDTLWYDEATLNHHRDDYTNNQDLIEVNYFDDGTQLSATASSQTQYRLNYSLKTECCVEFDVIKYSGTPRFFFLGNDFYLTNERTPTNTWISIKLVYHTTGVSCFINGQQITYAGTVNFENNNRMWIVNSASFKFKNFKIYSI